MDSSSDGSFAWTDASNDTSGSGPKINGTMNKGDTENESESGKSYKKKLQDVLFADMKGEEQLSRHKGRKRKLSERQSDSENVGTSKKKKIKKEPESDIDGSIATNSHQQNNNVHNDNDSYDERYLDSKVKAEQHFATPSPTKIKKKRIKTVSSSDISNEDSFEKLNNNPKKQSNDNFSKEIELDGDILNKLVQEENEHEYHEKKNKKKKKKSKRKDSTMSDDIDNKECSLQAVDTPGEEILSPNLSIEEPAIESLKEKKKKIKNKKKLSNQNVCEDVTEQTDKVIDELEQPVNKTASPNKQNESSKRTPRISERIQFEDDESSDVTTSQSQTKKTSSAKSNKMKDFLNNNLNLKPFSSQLDTRCLLTPDDEIWLIRCPRDVDVNAFHNKDIALEGKCKLKLSNHTYEGVVDNISGNMSVFSSENNNYVIKSLSLKGCVSLRKRIPKSHVHDEPMVNNQTNFIPLPETKCRHPLFGSNYKKSIKLPAAVAERLKAPEVTSHAETPVTWKKKKKKSDKEKRAEEDAELAVKPEQESELAANNKKKKKKRKHDDHDDSALRKVKRNKRDLESAEAWESEQAIEENLFNF